MGYEIDVLGVGEKSNSGDAIAIRYGNLHGDRSEQTVVIIDGGYKENGQDLVNHIRTHYNTDKVDLVISTHPDQDHINGLATVIEELDVTALWIHQPWKHNTGLAEKFKDGRITDNSIGEKLKDMLNTAHDLVQLAEERGVTVSEPFTNKTYDAITILGPSEEYYKELLPYFDGMPDVEKKAEEVNEEASGLASALYEAAKAVLKTIVTLWGADRIDDEDGTSAKNNSSVITQIIIEDRRLIFTADAGITALSRAADQLELCYSGAQLSFIQIPHHGSKRNVGPEVLNRIIGYPVSASSDTTLTAIASSAKEGEPKHPHKSVLNAFAHRGATVHVTRGDTIRHHHDAPSRGWGTIAPEPYHFSYEDEA